MKYNTKKEKNIAIGWFIAGEGTITFASIKRHTGAISIYPRVRVVNCDLKLLNQFKTLVGYGDINTTHKERPNPLYQWEIRCFKKCVPFLKEMIQFLPSKQEQAKLIIEYFEYRNKLSRKHPKDNNDFEFVYRMRKLNERPNQVNKEIKFLKDVGYKR